MQYWVLAVGLASLGGALTAEIRRRQRIRAFGDPAILGMSDRWFARLVPALLFAAGAASAAAAIAASYDQDTRPSRPPELTVMIDSTWDTRSAENRAVLLESIRNVAHSQPRSTISIFRSAPVPEKIGGRTRDTEGALILLDRISHRWTPDVRLLLPDALHALPRNVGDQKLVILTAMAVEEVEHMPAFPAIVVVRLSDEGAAEYGARTETGKWTWTSDAGKIGLLARAATAQRDGLRSWLRSRSAVQISAFVAFMLLTIGFLWETALAARRPRTLPPVPRG
jgi:hypothetical protein